MIFESDDYFTFYRVPDLATIFNVNERIIRKWISDGDLSAKKVGKEYLVTKASLKIFIQPTGNI
jgi:excisionase family DNA binding protein